ncbi:MAG: WGR domain-containing protein [bacterium]|nr:WGR domain-containing protein [bacterium]
MKPMQIDMKRIDPSQNMNRFYSVQLTQDLFGEHCVIRQWGRRGTRGQSLIRSYGTEDEAEGAVSKLIKQKLGRGYLLNFMPPKTRE